MHYSLSTLSCQNNNQVRVIVACSGRGSFDWSKASKVHYRGIHKHTCRDALCINTMYLPTCAKQRLSTPRHRGISIHEDLLVEETLGEHHMAC